MIELTPKASQRAREILASFGGKALRISAINSDGTDRRYMFSSAQEPEDGDEILDFDGLLIYADTATLSILGAGVVDCNENNAFVVYTLRAAKAKAQETLN